MDEEPAGIDATPHLQRLANAASRADGLLSQIENFRWRPHSSLWGDDSATSTDPLSYQVIGLLAQAWDSLNALKLIVVTAESLPVYACYPLMRNALECAGIALWMLGPPSRDERVLRALQTTYESRRDHWALEMELGVAPSDHFGEGLWAFDDVSEKLRARKGIAHRALRPPFISQRLKLAERHVKSRVKGQRPLLIHWRIASALNHGRRETTWAYTDALGDETLELGFRATMSANVEGTAEMLEAAHGYVQDVLDLLELRNQGR